MTLALERLFLFFFLLILRPPRSTLFPYTTLFRSCCAVARGIWCAASARTRRCSRWTTRRSEEHTSELQSRVDPVCRLLLEKKKRAERLTDAQRHERVNGEWSFVETLRHLLFAMDKWFTAPILGEGFHPIGMPNSGSVDFPWPDLDRDAAPSYDEVLAARAQRVDRFRAWLDELDAADLTREVEVLENGTVTVYDCVFTVLEEEFEHDRYADRDLAVLESRAGGDR